MYKGRPRVFEPGNTDHWVFSYDPRLGRVKKFVDANYTSPISLDRAASVAGLEKTYFSKYFREKTGVCFRDWLAAVRVDRAMEIMKARDLSITEIAFAVGFQDLRTFERVVERCTGLSPKAVKNRLRIQMERGFAWTAGDSPIPDA